MTEKQYKVGYFEDPVDIDDYVETIDGEYLNASDAVRLLNKFHKENEELKRENNELREDNDIKFWKLQCMHYFNSNSLFMSEISRAIKKGYKVSEQFQKYLDELKEDTKEIKEKNKRLFGDSDD